MEAQIPPQHGGGTEHEASRVDSSPSLSEGPEKKSGGVSEPPPERTVSSRTIYKGRTVSLRLDTVEKPGGRRTTREIVEHADVVAIVAIDGEGKVLLVRQFRQAVGKELLEIPAGGIEAGETPADCVRRELQEEIGYLPGELERLGGFYAAPGYCNEYLHLFLVRNLIPSQLYAEDTDEIRVVAVPLEQVPQLIASGQIQDAKSVAGLLRVMLRDYCI